MIATFNTNPMASYLAPQCALDIPNGVVFFLGQTADQFNASKGVLLESFDAKTYQLLGTLSLPDVTGHPIRLLRWGNAGLAFNMSGGTSSGNYLLQPPGGPIYLLDGAFVNSSKAADFTSGTELPALPAIASISPESALVNSIANTLTVTGSNFSSTSVVTWNGAAINSLATSTTQITASIPAADLATPGTGMVSVSDPATKLSANTSLAFTVVPSGSSELFALNLSSLDLAWDAKDARLIVPVWSADPRYPNSILSVDPATRTISKSAKVGSDPDLVRVTDDNSLVYAGFRTVNSVASLTLPNLGVGSSFWLGADPYAGPYYVYDLEPAPGAAQTTAVAFAVNGFQPPETNGISIFDNGVARPTGTGRTIGFQNIQWSPTSSKLYADDDAANLYTYGVDSSGLTLDSRNIVLNPPSTSTLQDIHFDAGTGYLYSDNGWVIDPSNGSVIGDFKASGLVVPDSSLHRVFILGQVAAQSGTSNYTIQSFDQTAFAPVHSLTLNALVGTPVAFVRWGATGLALVTYNQKADATNGPAGVLYIVSDSTVVSAQSVPAAAESDRVQAFPRVRPRTLSLPGSESQVSLDSSDH